MKKNLCREKILSFRKQLDKEFVKAQGPIVCAKIRNSKGYKEAKVIAIYYPILNEIDILDLLNDKDKIFLFPVLDENDDMKFVLPLSNNFERKYGFYQPVEYKDFNEKIDLAIIPCLDVNNHLKRLGYGRGYYDRYFNKYNQDCLKYAVIYHNKLYNDFKSSPYDITIDRVFTNVKNTAIILGSGLSQRYSDTKNKLLEIVYEKPIFMYSVDKFLSLDFEVILVVPKDFKNEFLAYVTNKNVRVVTGGKTRTNSLKKGLLNATGENIYIHDAARPLVKVEDILRLEEKMDQGSRACFLAQPIVSSLKQINKDNIYVTKKRENHVLAMTPQVAKIEDLINVFSLIKTKSYEDEVEMLNDFEIYSDIVLTSNKNYKLTYPNDLEVIEKNLSKPSLIGYSYDIHNIAYDRPLYLAGIKISENYGLDAVSDGDVIIHAIVESIMGALGKGDLGETFSPKDPRNENRSSVDFLKQIMELLNFHKYKIKNLDILLYLERPKLLEYKKEILINLKNLMEIKDNVINLKVTTMEGNGLIGKSNAIASSCCCLLEKI